LQWYPLMPILSGRHGPFNAALLDLDLFGEMNAHA
jgi:hypothetical protein